MKKKVVTIKELLEWFEGYIAKDKDGDIYLYNNQPSLNVKESVWDTQENSNFINFANLNYLFKVPELKDVDWKDSLRCPKVTREIPTKETPVGTKVWVRHNNCDWRRGIFFKVGINFLVFGPDWQIRYFKFCEIATKEDKINDRRED